VFDGLVGGDVHKQGVDLHELARPGRLEALRQAPGVALSDEAEAAPARLAPEHGHRRDAAALHEHGEDAPDGRDRDGDPLSAQQHGDLALAPHRMIGAQPLDHLHEPARPRRAADPMRSPALRLYALLPAIQRRPGDPDALRGNGGAQPAAHQKTPALKRVASDRCCA
jgi:hypothetical protein